MDASDGNPGENIEQFCRHSLPHSCNMGILFCGSFYEQPFEYAMLNLTDVDHMFFDRNVIAAAETAVISESFHGEILTLETKDCHLGFARLLRGRKGKTKNIGCSRKFLHGPALKKGLMTHKQVSYIYGCARKRTPNFMTFKALDLTIDNVRSVLCPNWPSEADEWLTRKRCSGWPTKEMIENIVAGGCHLVPKSHENNPDDDNSWRFSFSQAELILLNTWNEIQTYIYHILRILKSEVIANRGGEKKTFLCTYYFKTLMLWACEQKHSDFWNEDRIEETIEELLLQMIQWIIDKNCPNFFIRENNMFDYLQSGVDVTSEVLLLHNALTFVQKVVAFQPMIFRGKVFNVLVSDKALLLAQLSLNRKHFTNVLNHKHRRWVVEKLSSSPLLSREVEHLFKAVQLHRLLMSDLMSSGEKISGKRKSYETEALSNFKNSCQRKETNSYSEFYISSLDSISCTVDKFMFGTPDEQRQRMCCYRRTDEGNWTKEAMEALCQTFISTLDNNHHNPSYFISAGYYANFCYTCLHDYRQALRICEDALASVKALNNGFIMDRVEHVFLNEILCVFMSHQYITIHDAGIQVIFGFLTLCVTTVKQAEIPAMRQELPDCEHVYQLCPIEFLEYVRFRCRNRLHVYQRNCGDVLNLYKIIAPEHSSRFRNMSNAIFAAAIRVHYSLVSN